VAKVGFWSRLFGGQAGTVGVPGPDAHIGAVLLQQILKPAGQDRAAPGLHANPAISLAFVPTPAPQSMPGPTELLSFDTEGGGPTVTLLVDWPWQLAHGLTPFTADASAARKEPSGWLENHLAQAALASPLQVEFSADTFDAFGGDPSFLALAGEARDVLGLSGDFSAGFTLAAPSFEVNRVVVADGDDYHLAANDNFVAAGGTLVIDASAVGDGNEVRFDGSGETDGRFSFIGGGGGDFFFGGGGADRIDGGEGGDLLSGAGGGDVFVYRDPAHSSGTDYDTIADFDPAADRIDLPGAVSGFGAAVTAGALSTATFDSDLAAAVGNLGASQAIWFAPNAGDLAGRIFLVVDGNGKAGYQAGEDFVIAIAGAPLADLTGHTDIFI
jgi:peptidase M10/serralysin-like protein